MKCAAMMLTIALAHQICVCAADEAPNVREGVSVDFDTLRVSAELAKIEKTRNRHFLPMQSGASLLQQKQSSYKPAVQLPVSSLASVAHGDYSVQAMHPGTSLYAAQPAVSQDALRAAALKQAARDRIANRLTAVMDATRAVEMNKRAAKERMEEMMKEVEASSH